MIGRRKGVALTLMTWGVALGCGGGGQTSTRDPTAGTIAGSVHGTQWNALSNAYWIGKPAMGSPPVILFMFEAPVACADIVNPNWDKTATGSRQILEVALLDSAARTYQVMTDAFAAYLLADYNPDANAGTITVGATTPSVDMQGSFQLQFLNDSLTGTFDAKYCTDGTEP